MTERGRDIGPRVILAAAALALLALFLPTPARAQDSAPVVVRGGEHEEYTRVVLYAGAGEGWTLRQGEDVISVQLDRPDTRFDLSTAMDRLYLRRVVGITTGPREAELHLKLDCRCGARAYRAGPGLIVVDVGPDLGTPGRDSAAAGAAQRPVPRPGGGSPAPRPEGMVSLPLLPGGEAAGSGSEGPPAPQDPPLRGDLLPPLELPANRDPDLAEAEERLLRQLGRAASQGLLTPRAPLRPATPPDPAAPPEAARRTAPEPPPEEDVNLRAITSIDAGSQRLLDQVANLLDDDRCLPDSLLDLRGWADPDKGFDGQIAELRASIIGEFDRVDPAAVTDLARAYLHYGFGAEAERSLDLRPEPARGDAVLRAIARIMEHGHDRRPGGAPGVLADQQDCPGHAALWSVLARDPLPRGLQVNGSALRGTFNAFPAELRLYLGPILARRLLAGGHAELSDAVLRMTDRVSEGPDERLDLARAELLLDRGATGAAIERLESVADSDGEMSPEALAALVDTTLSEGGSVPPDLARRIAALEPEHRDGPLGPRLQQALALAEASGGNFAEAFGLVAAHRDRWPEQASQATRDRLLSLLAANAAEAEFLRRAMTLPAREAAALRPATGNAMAARLLELGFAEMAERYLQRDLRGSEDRPRRLLRARAALARGEPAGVDASLTGIEGPEADRLRAEARAMAGDAVEASRLFSDLGDTDRAAELAWAAGAWDQAGELAPGPISDAARLARQDRAELLDPEGAPLPEDKVLARNRALLDTSQSARETLQSLLSATRIAPDAPEGGTE